MARVIGRGQPLDGCLAAPEVAHDGRAGDRGDQGIEQIHDLRGEEDARRRPPQDVCRCALIGAASPTLPADRYPNLTAIVGAMTAGGGDERFAFGVEVFIAGLAARAGRAP